MQSAEDTLRSTKREGVEDLIKFLNESDFFSAPCSTQFHLACQGGLVEHTVNVVECAVALWKKYSLLTDIPVESVVLAAFCHDFCKINFYKEVHEDPSDAQVRYLTSLLTKNGVRLKPGIKMNKAYASVLIDFMLKTYKPGIDLPEFIVSYQVVDQLPLGHGEKSLFITQQFLKLTKDEALAVRWHMASFDAGIHFDYPSGFAYREAVKQSKLVTIITIADIEASNLVEA
jgi:hypothetical protein